MVCAELEFVAGHCYTTSNRGSRDKKGRRPLIEGFSARFNTVDPWLIKRFEGMILFDSLLKKRKVSSRSSDGCNIELLSLHMPKTAGSSFSKVLMEAYGDGNILFDYEDRPLDPSSQFNADYPNWLKRKNAFIQDMPETTRVIHGHFPIAKYAGLFSSAKKILWLREPVSRLVSHYFYWKKTPLQKHALHKFFLEENLSLLEFAEIPIMQNIVARIFLKETDLAQFYFIGIQEFFEDDLSQLATMLKWPAREAPDLNKNDDPLYSDFRIDKSLFEKLARLNLEDVEIYRRALQLRADRRGKRDY